MHSLMQSMATTIIIDCEQTGQYKIAQQHAHAAACFKDTSR
jgi:hypothetical protein